MIVLAGQRDLVPDDSWDTGGRQRVIQAVLESLDRGPRLTQARESTPAYAESGVSLHGFPSELLPAPWLWAGHILCLPVLLLATLPAPWQRLRDSETSHVFLGTCVALIALWHLRAGIEPGLQFHLLGATTMTLMFGWRLAIAGMSLVVLATTASGLNGWDALSVNILLTGVLPVAVSHLVLHLAQHWLPPNFFIYVFVNGYCGAALAITAAVLSSALLLWLSGVYGLRTLGSGYLVYLPLVALPEAWVNGSVVALLVGLHPQWVSTFEDSRYLNGR